MDNLRRLSEDPVFVLSLDGMRALLKGKYAAPQIALGNSIAKIEGLSP